MQTDSGAHPVPIQWVPGALSPGVKRPGRVVGHSPTTSAKVKKVKSVHLLHTALNGVVFN
jgi:hypothetical protein